MIGQVGHGAAGIAELFKRAGQSCSCREPEFATINADLSLTPSSQPQVQILPHTTSPGGYRVMRWRVFHDTFTTTATVVGANGSHTHTVPATTDYDQPVPVVAGDTVVIVWIGSTPVILGRID
jgi:hypothetical protein